jgi:mRNA-degrading endonuclease toxin of MazEF toxin-antitoxin module
MEVQHGGLYLYEPPQVPKSEPDAKFVASGHEQLGERPYIIMSRDKVNAGKPTAVGVPFTTRIHKANSYRVLLPAGEFIAAVDSNYVFENSVALCDHVRVIDLERVRKKIGQLSENGVFAVQLGLTFVFGIR